MESFRQALRPPLKYSVSVYKKYTFIYSMHSFLDFCVKKFQIITLLLLFCLVAPTTSLSQITFSISTQNNSLTNEPNRIEPKAWTNEIDITVIDEGKWGCVPEDCRRVMLSAAKEIWKHFPSERKIPRFVVKYSDLGHPFFRYNIGEDQHSLILIHSGKCLWAQMAYQFAHEFCHNLSNYSGKNPQWWFGESLAEAASRFALSRMAETWKINPPYSNWAEYSPSLQSYFDDLQRSDRLPSNTTLNRWYRENEKALSNNFYDRPKNNVVAAELNEILNTHPEYWDAVSFYPRQPVNPDTFENFLRVWKKNCPNNVKPFPDAIAKKFGYTLS